MYGPARLPLLLQGWDVLADFGFSPKLFENGDQHGREALFVLCRSDDPSFPRG